MQKNLSKEIKIKQNAEELSTSQIVPRKKPLLLGYTKKYSSVLKDKDFSLARKSFSYIKRRSWKSAISTANKSSDILLPKIVTWMYLKEENISQHLRIIKNLLIKIKIGQEYLG